MKMSKFIAILEALPPGARIRLWADYFSEESCVLERWYPGRPISEVLQCMRAHMKFGDLPCVVENYSETGDWIPDQLTEEIIQQELI